MKKFLAMLLALTALLLSACSNDTTADESMPENTNKTVNEAVDYYFYYPKAWELDRNDGMISIKSNMSTIASQQSFASISVTSYNLPDPKQLVDTYWEKYSEDISATFNEYEFLNEEKIELDKIVAARYEYTGKLSGNKYKFSQVICIRNGIVYLVTLTAKEADFDKTVIDFEKVIEYFHFK